MPPSKPHSNLNEVDFGRTIRGLQKDDVVFERFTLKRLLARGGMGAVWLAGDMRLGRDVALKFAPQEVRWDDVAVEELKEETRKGLALAHPNIVKIYDFLLDETHAAISMEFIDGENLSSLRTRQPNKIFEVRQLTRWTAQLLDALEYAHRSAKVIHRDLKPANLMIDRNDDLRVTDFGIARSISDAMDRATMESSSTGTLAYMSPQQAAGKRPQVTDDLYALGSTLYELLTGKPPFFAGAIAQQLSHEPVLPLTERRCEFGISDAEPIPEAWECTVLACLAKTPEERPASIADIRRRLGLSAVVAGAGADRVPALPPEGSLPTPAPAPELAHVLFADVVGYSRFASDEQARLLQQLRGAVRHSNEFNLARRGGSLISIPAGDGMALVFLGGDALAPLRAAREISQALRAGASFGLRIGLHSGPVYRVADINGSETVAGAGINLAQRVMDCGDAGHILVSQVHASYLRQSAGWEDHLQDLGDAEVKHGVRLHLLNYWDGTDGNPQLPAKLSPLRASVVSSIAGTRVALIYKRHTQPDETLLQALEAALRERGCEVFVDRHVRIGLDWAREIERALRNADAVIPLLSPESVTSDMLAYELEIADDASQKQGGKPRLLPIRVNREGPLPDSLGAILDPIQYSVWRGPQDTPDVVAELTSALAEPGTGPVRSSRALEPPGGAMPLDSLYYVSRPTDAEFHAAIARRDSLVLVEGARQMGKTSLLSRGLQQARAGGAKVTCTDFQKLNSGDLASLESFYLTLGSALASQLNLDKYPEDTWRSKSGPNQNFESYLRRQVLAGQRGSFVWALDEVDRLFTCPFGSEVFGLFRSWHNARALDPESPWRRLTLIICYATEAHLFITDMNQSPFNVGTRVRLRDFGLAEMHQINERYGEPLTNADEFERFYRLLGGQPYLVRRGLHEMVANRTPLADLERTAPLEHGPFGDHLKRFLVLLSGNPGALAFLSALLAGKKGGDAKLFYRLRAGGLLRGETPADADFRCDLYAQYLKRHLP